MKKELLLQEIIEKYFEYSDINAYPHYVYFLIPESLKLFEFENIQAKILLIEPEITGDYWHFNVHKNYIIKNNKPYLCLTFGNILRNTPYDKCIKNKVFKFKIEYYF